MPANVSWLGDTPQYWSTYLPQESDYETTDDYLKAVAEASRAYYEGSKPIGEYWDPIGQVTRGGAQTEVEQGLRKLQNKFANIGDNPLNSMGLENWIRNNEKYARAAYGAFDELGNPVLDRSVLAMIERVLGIGAAPVASSVGPPPVVSENPPSVTAPPGMVMGPDGTWVADPNGTTAHVIWGSDGQYVELPNGAEVGKPVQAPDGTWYVMNPDGSASLFKNPPATGPGAAWNPGGATQNSDGTYTPPAPAPTPTPGQSQGNMMPGPRHAAAPQPEALQYMSGPASSGVSLMAQMGINPPQVAAESNALYPDFILQRLNQRRKGVQYGAPFVPRGGY